MEEKKGENGENLEGGEQGKKKENNDIFSGH